MLNDALAKIPTATDIFGTYGYMISTKSAKKLLELQTYKNAMPLDNLFSDVIKYRELIAYLSTKKIMTYDRSLPSDIEAMGRPK